MWPGDHRLVVRHGQEVDHKSRRHRYEPSVAVVTGRGGSVGRCRVGHQLLACVLQPPGTAGQHAPGRVAAPDRGILARLVHRRNKAPPMLVCVGRGASGPVFLHVPGGTVTPADPPGVCGHTPPPGAFPVQIQVVRFGALLRHSPDRQSAATGLFLAQPSSSGGPNRSHFGAILRDTLAGVGAQPVQLAYTSSLAPDFGWNAGRPCPCSRPWGCCWA